MDENDSIGESNFLVCLDGSNSSLTDPSAEGDDQPCKVCGDKSSGLHYGVMSCEGCKGFFRRSIQKQIDYRCLQNGLCDINRTSRNRCQYCRFKKCLAVGMSKDSVRYGRVPKRLKSATDEERVSQTGTQSTRAPGHQDRELAIYDVILTISQAHHTHCMTTDDKLTVMKKRSTSLCQVTSSSMEEQKCGMWQRLAEEFAPCVQRLVEFSKHVPGFADVSQDDQLILIKSAFFEMWLTRLARLFGDDGSDQVLTLSDGLQIPRIELETIYSQEFVDSMFTFAHNFNHLKLSDTEIGLFTAVVLTSPDRANVSEPRKVERILDRLIEALNLQITRNHPHETSLFGNILMKLPDLKALGASHSKELEFYRSQWLNMKLPALVAEVFDIPKLEDEEQIDSEVKNGAE